MSKHIPKKYQNKHIRRTPFYILTTFISPIDYKPLNSWLKLLNFSHCHRLLSTFLWRDKKKNYISLLVCLVVSCAVHLYSYLTNSIGICVYFGDICRHSILIRLFTLVFTSFIITMYFLFIRFCVNLEFDVHLKLLMRIDFKAN